ncbi:hypothetical protein [Acidovorax sp.]|uniref:hypothetical protein n=1 Tax=Acidovorax sp. TaxID=1872122 RepID=UPI00391EFCF9
MDSINKRQAEDTHHHLNGADAVARIREMAEDAGSCFFCTNAPQGDTRGTRPMGVEKVDEAGTFGF